MPRYRLTIAYDGTDFCGWQKQTPPEQGTLPEHILAPDPELPIAAAAAEPDEANDGRPRVELRTVQAVVERAVRAVVREPAVLMGASRTDSGVHARGQVAAFTCSDGGARGIGWPLDRGTESLLRAINSRLPRDVLVLGAEVADDAFNPIQGATSKCYTYTIWNGPMRPLWERTTTLHLWTPLEVGRMREAAQLLVGEHDFAGFAAAGHGRMSTVRTVFSCTVTDDAIGAGNGTSFPSDAHHAGTQSGHGTRRISIAVTGNGFLWNMVRIIAGTLVDVGRGRIDLDRVAESLRTGKRELAGPTLPPQGLCLEWIRYA